MKKLILIGALAAVLLSLSGCELRKFVQIISINLDRTYTLDFQGSTSFGPMTLTRADLLDKLNFPEKSRVTDSYIESISLTLSQNPQNEASIMVTSGRIVKPDGSKKVWDFFPTPINSASISLANNLVEEGIVELTTQILEILKNPASQATITLQFDGSSGERAALDFHLQIVAAIEYEFCQEVPPFSEGGEECDL